MILCSSVKELKKKYSNEWMNEFNEWIPLSVNETKIAVNNHWMETL